MTPSEQAFPEQALLKRRRQILDDETGAAERASASADLSSHQDTGHEDVWVRSFLSRLAGRIRDIGRGGK
jgi:hypothetical protein